MALLGANLHNFVSISTCILAFKLGWKALDYWKALTFCYKTHHRLNLLLKKISKKRPWNVCLTNDVTTNLHWSQYLNKACLNSQILVIKRGCFLWLPLSGVTLKWHQFAVSVIAWEEWQFPKTTGFLVISWEHFLSQTIKMFVWSWLNKQNDIWKWLMSLKSGCIMSTTEHELWGHHRYTSPVSKTQPYNSQSSLCYSHDSKLTGVPCYGFSMVVKCSNIWQDFATEIWQYILVFFPTITITI